MSKRLEEIELWASDHVFADMSEKNRDLAETLDLKLSDYNWLIFRIEKLQSAVEYAYDWSIKHTPTIRPYDLTDAMKKALEDG